jgi:hypothetical protein
MSAAEKPATQAWGEGPWKAAERLAHLAGDNNFNDIMALAHLLKKSYQDQNNDSSDNLKNLPVGYQWVNQDNIDELMKDPTFKKVYDKLSQQQAANSSDQQTQRQTVKRTNDEDGDGDQGQQHQDVAGQTVLTA